MPRVDSAARDRSCIEHILKYCEQIDESLNEIQQDKARFLASHTYQNAIAMCVLQIGELTKHLSEDFVVQHRSIPWSLMAKTRDNYAHHYGSADFEMIWDTATGDIPAVKDFCLGFLNNH